MTQYVQGDRLCPHPSLLDREEYEGLPEIHWLPVEGCGVVLDMALPTHVMESWLESPRPEGMCIALEMDCNSLLISFLERLLVL